MINIIPKVNFYNYSNTFRHLYNIVYKYCVWPESCFGLFCKILCDNLGKVVLRRQRNRMGRPLSPPQIHLRSFERWANYSKQHLNTSRGHQAPRKAAHFLQKEVGQNIKDKKREKGVRDGELSWWGSCKREVSKHQETLSRSLGSFGIWEGSVKKERKKESEVAQLCLTLCDPMDWSLPGSSIHGIFFQARILEWVVISFSRRSSRPRDWTWVSHIAGRFFNVWATREAYWEYPLCII